MLKQGESRSTSLVVVGWLLRRVVCSSKVRFVQFSNVMVRCAGGGSEGTDRRNLMGLWSRHSKKVIGKSSQSCIFSSSGAETKVASMCEDPLRLTKVGSCSGGLMQESSFYYGAR